MKKVLIIAYYWPPAGGPGVQRWVKFVKYLRNFGIEPIVYVPENPTYPLVDTNIGQDLPGDITVLKKPIKEPYKLASLFFKKKTKSMSAGMVPRHKATFLEKCLLWVRGNLFIPDARIAWVSPSVHFLKNYMTAHTIDTLITTGPPHSMHLIGLQLKELLPISWIADFRDPWTTIGYHQSLRLGKAAAKKHEYLEQSVLQKADAVLVTSYTTQKELQQKTIKPVYVITNGYDTSTAGKVPLSKKFTIAHIGSLLSGRNPEVLWKVFSEMIMEDPDFSDNFELQLIGKVSQEVYEKISSYGLERYISYEGYVTHEQAIHYQRAAQVLLLVEIDSDITKGIIPGKVFEYMVSGRHILAIGPERWDVSTIISRTNTGRGFKSTDATALTEYLKYMFLCYKEGNLAVSAIGLQQYSRKALTSQLAQVIQSLE